MNYENGQNWSFLEATARHRANWLVDEGSFIPYPKSFLAFLFDMRHTFGFPTK